MLVVAITLAPTRAVFSLICLVIAWLMLTISIYKHGFFERRQKWEQRFYNSLSAVFLAGILAVVWFASLPESATPVKPDEVTGPSWLRQYASTGWNYFKYALMRSLPYAGGFVAALLLINLKRVFGKLKFDGKIVIVSPRNNDGVEWHHMVHGSVIPPNAPVQVLVFSGDGLWYLQRHVEVRNSVWSVECTFGNEGKPGGSYNLIAVLGHELKEKTYKNLPDGLVTSDLVTVQRLLLQPNCPEKWLHQLKAVDQDGINDLVRVAGIQYRPEIVKGEPSYIEFRFAVFNNSVCEIGISDSITGEIRYGHNAKKFESIPKMEENQAKRCIRGPGYFTIRQWLNPAEAEYFSSPASNDTSFSFENLEVRFNGTDQCPNIKSTRLYTAHYFKKQEGFWLAYEPQIIFASDPRQWAELVGLERVRRESERAALISERDELKNRLEKLAADALPRLTFEICERESQVHIDGGSEIQRINAKVKLRCLKTTDSPMAVRDFHASLHKQEGKETALTVIAQEDAKAILGSPRMESYKFDNGWTIDEPLTDYRWFMFCLEITPKDLATFSRDHFLRITMDAIGQGPVSQEFYVDSWLEARNSNSSITMKKQS